MVDLKERLKYSGGAESVDVHGDEDENSLVQQRSVKLLQRIRDDHFQWLGGKEAENKEGEEWGETAGEKRASVEKKGKRHPPARPREPRGRIRLGRLSSHQGHRRWKANECRK